MFSSLDTKSQGDLRMTLRSSGWNVVIFVAIFTLRL